MKRHLPLLAGLVLVIGTTFVQGIWTQRWQKSEALQVAAERLAGAPDDLGTWHGQRGELEAGELVAAGAEASWVRQFTDSRTSASVLVILLCGQPGLMSVHRPEHCYRAAGFELMGDSTHFQVVGDPPAECWTNRFRKEGPTGTMQLRIYWTWFGDGAWRAPRSPRLTFAHLPVLYKLYAIHELPAQPGRPADDPTIDLLQQLLPALARVLAPS
jgi:hypothetical protein